MAGAMRTADAHTRRAIDDGARPIWGVSWNKQMPRRRHYKDAKRRMNAVDGDAEAVWAWA